MATGRGKRVLLNVLLDEQAVVAHKRVIKRTILDEKI
jgi:hypothetical protein